MTSENEVSLLMRVLQLICSSSSCGNAFKSFLYLRLQMAIDIFGMNKTVNLRILPLFNLYTNAKLPYWSILSYHNKCTVVMTNMAASFIRFEKKRMIAIWSSAVDSVFFLWLFSGIFSWTQVHSVTICYEHIVRRRNRCLVLSGLMKTWSMIRVQHLACCNR